MMIYSVLGIPPIGWIAITIWLVVNIIPWTYSMFFVKKINNSGVERWGAKKSNSKSNH